MFCLLHGFLVTLCGLGPTAFVFVLPAELATESFPLMVQSPSFLKRVFKFTDVGYIIFVTTDGLIVDQILWHNR